MIYDKNPPYPHYDNLPYAKEPWKSLYVFQRLLTTLALVPWWILYYSVIPRRYRPRTSWNLRQIVNVNCTRRIFRVTEVAGVTWVRGTPTLPQTNGRSRRPASSGSNHFPSSTVRVLSRMAYLSSKWAATFGPRSHTTKSRKPGSNARTTRSTSRRPSILNPKWHSAVSWYLYARWRILPHVCARIQPHVAHSA